ncbi:hypothetical protein GCM10022198_23840 [Klugiella xanthotipulae]|uniref:VWFA domain-containing protein n=1 Tax=Klugiella xanthotipulae TaxID=244735 RepID=A0A543I6H9_9MICO|nr:hypothetical protein [Klugiella xanthotipulae]TQM66169.1 hypothetical protein FB466_0999 [Klugiella xanthotipulae]
MSFSGALSAAAREVVADILGSDASDLGHAQNVIVALDSSASLQPRIAEGAVRAVLDVIAAVAERLGTGCEIIGTLAGTGTVLTRLPGVTALTLVDTLLDAASHQQPTTGFRIATRDVMPYAPLSNVGRTPATRTYLVTDTVPSNVAEFTASAGSPHDTQHLVVLTSQSAWSLLRPPAVPCTVVDIQPGPLSPAEHLLHAPGALRDLIVSLLSRGPAEVAAESAGPRTGRRAAR